MKKDLICILCKELVSVEVDEDGQVECPICHSWYPYKYAVNLHKFELDRANRIRNIDQP